MLHGLCSALHTSAPAATDTCRETTGARSEQSATVGRSHTYTQVLVDPPRCRQKIQVHTLNFSRIR